MRWHSSTSGTRLTAAPTAPGTGFDPRNIKPRIGQIGVAQGRDAANVPLIHSFGPHVPLRFGVRADEVREGVGLGGQRPVDADGIAVRGAGQADPFLIAAFNTAEKTVFSPIS